MRCLAAIVLMLLSFPSMGQERWMLIDTEARQLKLMEGDRAVQVYENISIGRDGASRTRFLGGERTPLGTYRVTEIRQKTRYHRFFTIDYPSLQDARRALDAGKIGAQDLERIRRAHEQGRDPPWDTPLGGNIGIHGLGSGDPRFHEDFNWTDGCVAMTNEQVDALAPHVRVGMTVIIL